jgi:hypothetical protein
MIIVSQAAARRSQLSPPSAASVDRPKFHKSPSPESAMWTIGHTDTLPQRRAALKVLRPGVFEVSYYFEATVAITANAIEVSLYL